jgi:hypothetical protein
VGVRTGIPGFVRSRLPKSASATVILSASISVIVGVAVLVAVHATDTGSMPLASETGKAVQSTGKVAQSAQSALSLGAAHEVGSPQIARLKGAGSASPKAKKSSKATASPSASLSRGVGSSPPTATSSPTVGATAPSTTPSGTSGSSPVGGASYAGSLIMDTTGSQLVSWNATSSYCPNTSWQIADGQVSTDSSGAATLETSGKLGSCVAAISPGAYSSAVVEASIDFPALPSSPNTIANWTTLWMTNQASWPMDGELDAAEVTPNTGKSAVTYHWGTPQSVSRISTDGPTGDVLPIDAPDLTPGWHTVDIVYTKGFFAVYYDGKLYTTLTSDIITGDPLSILLTAAVTPDTSAVEQELTGPPVNSDSSPATIAVNYVKVWSYR